MPILKITFVTVKTNKKSLRILTAMCSILILLTSCGNKLYSYRKTVKVKEAVVKNEPSLAGTKVYMTVKEVKSGKASLKSTPSAMLNVNQNTIYYTTKPVSEKEEAPLLRMPSPIYGAVIR